jgi:hypothetical protein
MEALTMDVFRDAPGLGASRVLLAGGGHRPRARDHWLRLFGQGGWADTAPGSGWLALQAHTVSRPELLRKATSDEVLGIGRAWKALETWTFARKLTVVRELIRRRPLDERWEPGGLPGEWEASLHHEIAAALGISTVAAGKLARLAWTLDTRLRGIGQALEDNRLDPARVKLIADETSVLEDETLYPRAEQIILDGLPSCRTWGALQRLVQRAVITVDPDGARRRREQAEREHARLRFWRENCGTCAMQATGLPTDEALAANANIEARARAYKAAQVDRPMDILRVMAYLDLINGVTVEQRAAWARAEDEGRQAEEAERQARKHAHDAATSRGGQDPEAGKGPGASDDNGPDGGASDGGSLGAGPDDDGPGEPDGSGPGRDGPVDSGPGSPVGGVPSGGGPGTDPDGNGPGSPGPDGGVPDGGPDCGGPDGEPGSDDRGGLVAADGSHPGNLPADDCGLGDDGPQPEDPGDGHEDPDLAGSACQQCGGMGGGTGPPVRASLTIPAGALEWLAGRPASPAPAGPSGPPRPAAPTSRVL